MALALVLLVVVAAQPAGIQEHILSPKNPE